MTSSTIFSSILTRTEVVECDPEPDEYEIIGDDCELQYKSVPPYARILTYRRDLGLSELEGEDEMYQWQLDDRDTDSDLTDEEIYELQHSVMLSLMYWFRENETLDIAELTNMVETEDEIEEMKRILREHKSRDFVVKLEILLDICSRNVLCFARTIARKFARNPLIANILTKFQNYDVLFLKDFKMFIICCVLSKC